MHYKVYVENHPTIPFDIEADNFMSQDSRGAVQFYNRRKRSVRGDDYDTMNVVGLFTGVTRVVSVTDGEG